MPECAFCSYKGKLSAEHIPGKWARKLFPGMAISKTRDRATGLEKSMTWSALDLKYKVVCKKCNETWMSAIEGHHAKPVLTPLITGEFGIPIGLSEARSIALYAFKSAVVLDSAAGRSRESFFSRAERYAFRESLAIPSHVRIWLAPFYGNRNRNKIVTVYHKPNTGNRWLMYVCTLAIGHVAIQVLSIKEMPSGAWYRCPMSTPWIPIWPGLERGYIWPGDTIIRDREQFLALARRWQHIEVLGDKIQVSRPS